LIGLDPLIILSPNGKKEIMPVTADGNGNYRATLPPEEYSWMSKTAGVGMSAPYRNRSQYWQINPSIWMAIDYGRSLISEPAASHPIRLTATTA